MSHFDNVLFPKALTNNKTSGDPGGMALQFESSLSISGAKHVPLEGMGSVLDNLLVGPFSNPISNKSLQEIIIYAYSIFKKSMVNKIGNTYEWGDKTCTTVIKWEGIILSKVMVARQNENHDIPISRMIDIERDTYKVDFNLKIKIRPMSESELSSYMSNPGHASIYPTLFVPEIVKKYRETSNKRVNSVILMSDKKKDLTI
ncbi:TPA_asm: P3 [Alnus trirhavirus 1]|nr:TPA_asm: P3 [Alnus trirhavirus 1]